MFHMSNDNDLKFNMKKVKKKYSLVENVIHLNEI